MRDDYSHLVGHRFPGGRARVDDWLDALWCDATLSERHPPHAHPGLAYVACLEGSGVSIQDLFDLMEADADSGAMFGEQRLEYLAPVVIGRDYEVEGEVTSVVRKHGRRAGTFDMLTFVLRLREPGAAEPAVVNTNTFIFPRPEAAA
jgi:hypothetical protein